MYLLIFHQLNMHRLRVEYNKLHRPIIYIGVQQSRVFYQHTNDVTAV